MKRESGPGNWRDWKGTKSARSRLGRQRPRRGLIAVAAALAMLAVMGSTMAVFRFSQESAGERAGRYVFGFSISTMNNPYCAYLEKTLRALVEADGHAMITRDPQYDQQKQLSQVERMLEDGIDLLFLCPVNNREITPALMQCREAGAPIVNYDCAVDEAEWVDTIIISDNFLAGGMCARGIMQNRPQGCPVAILDDQKATSVVKRMQGFLNALDQKKYPIAARVDTDGSLEDAMPKAIALLQAMPEIGAFMCANDTVAEGVVAALEVTGRGGDILVYGVDGSPDAKKLIRDGKMTATMAQSPIQQARYCYAQALKILAGEQVEKVVVTDIFQIDLSNIDNFDLAGWQ